jgi:prepilin-type N-terminal cleavage/methylation domain-containing protein
MAMPKKRTRRHGLTLMELVVVLVILVALAGILVPLMTGVNSDAQYTTTKSTMAALRNAVMQYYQDMKGIPLNRPIPGTAFTSDSTGMPQTLKDLQIQPALTDTSANSILFNPVSQRGWRGPYLLQATGTFQPQATAPAPGVSLDASFYPGGYPPAAGSYFYGSPGDVAFLDAWGNPIVLQWPSVGSSGLADPTQDLAQRILYVRLVSAGAPTQNSSGKTASVIDTLLAYLMPTRPTAAFPTLPNQRGNDIVLFILTQDQYPWMPTN